MNYFIIKAANSKVFPPALGRESTAATGNKRTYEGTSYPAKPKKKKRKSDSAFIRFLEILIIINTPFLSQIVELDNSNNDSDYIIIVTYTWEELTPRLAMELRFGNRLIIKMKLYQ